MKCTKIYNARAQPLFCSLNLLFSDVPVAVAFVAFFKLPYKILWTLTLDSVDHCGNNISLTRSVHVCLVVKWGCHSAYTNENSVSGNQKATLECGVSFKQKSLTFMLLCNFVQLHIAIGLRNRFTDKNNEQSFRLRWVQGVANGIRKIQGLGNFFSNLEI